MTDWQFYAPSMPNDVTLAHEPLTDEDFGEDAPLGAEFDSPIPPVRATLEQDVADMRAAAVGEIEWGGHRILLERVHSTEPPKAT